MKRSNWVKLVVFGLVGAVVLVGYCRESSAHPSPFPHVHPHPGGHHHHTGFHHPMPPVVVRYAPTYPVVVRPPVQVYSVLPSNPAPVILRVAIVNPAATGTTLSFTIDGERYDLASGARQEMRLAGIRTIEFDRGPSLGQVSYSLYEGVYTFKATPAGWDLQRQPYGLVSVTTVR